MNIFLYDDYRHLIKDKIKEFPRKGHGQIQKISQALNVSQSQVSQILKGIRKLSDAQAFILSKYFSFGDLETEYFLILVQMANTQHSEVKTVLKKNLKRISELSNREPTLDRNMTTLGDVDQLLFYSNRNFMAVWLLTSIQGFNTAEKISEHLRISTVLVKEILHFLTDIGLCEKKNDFYSMRIKRTLVTRGSPMLSRHHMNWRLQGIEVLQSAPHESLFYTSPMTLSVQDSLTVKQILLKSISAIEPIVGPSKAEKTFCLNIDWFEF